MIRRSALATLLAVAAACAVEDSARVLITSPRANAATNGTIAITVAYDGAPISAVLLVDGAPRPLEAPFTAASLDTRELAEGPVTLVVEATFRSTDAAPRLGFPPLPSPQPTGDAMLVRSAPLTVRVDRTPPLAQGSVAAEGPADPADAIAFTFSEPVTFDAIRFDWGDAESAPPAVHFTLSPNGRVLTVTGLPDDAGRSIRSVAFGLHFETLRDAAGNAMTQGPWRFTWLTQRRMNADPEKAAYHPAFARDASGAPVLAWSEMRPWIDTGAEGEGPFVQLARWDGTAWGALPFTSAGTPAGYGWEPDLAFDGAGRPVVIATDAESAVRVTLRSADWEPLGGPLSTPWDFTPSIAANGEELVAAWVDEIPTGDPTTHVYCGDVAVARWDGAAWTRLGGPLNAEGTCGSRPKVAYDWSGRPWIAWQQGAFVQTASWSDTGWLARGAIPAVTFDLASEQGDVVLLTGADALQLWKWGAGEWIRGVSLATSPAVYFFGPAALSDDGAAVAWIDGDGVRAAVVGPTGLEPLGTFQISAIPGSDLRAFDPAVVHEADGTVTVAFFAYGDSGRVARVYTHAFTR